MAQRSFQPRPLSTVSKGWLFTPVDGSLSHGEERTRIFSQQPLKGPALPHYLIPTRSSTLRPPKLRYGWRLGHKKLMDMARAHFPSVVCRRGGPAELGFLPEEELDLTGKWYEEMNDNIAETLFSPEIIIAICDYLSIDGPEVDELITIQFLYDSQAESKLGLTVGSNYAGVLTDDRFAKLEALVVPDEDAMWYLDNQNYKWRRISAPKADPKGASKKAATTNANKATVESAAKSVPIIS